MGPAAVKAPESLSSTPKSDLRGASKKKNFRKSCQLLFKCSFVIVLFSEFKGKIRTYFTDQNGPSFLQDVGRLSARGRTVSASARGGAAKPPPCDATVSLDSASPSVTWLSGGRGSTDCLVRREGVRHLPNKPPPFSTESPAPPSFSSQDSFEPWCKISACSGCGPEGRVGRQWRKRYGVTNAGDAVTPGPTTQGPSL